MKAATRCLTTCLTLLLCVVCVGNLSDITDLRLCGLASLLGMAALGMALVSVEEKDKYANNR